jgi:uncharacterized membrane protein YdjX (TVP38/TMEM64 family)
MKKIWILIIFLSLLVGVFQYRHRLSFERIKASREAFSKRFDEDPVFVSLAFMLVYVVVTASSLPLATPLSLAGGAVFGVVKGTLMVSFASSIGATLAFLVSRMLLGEWLQNRFSDQLVRINAGLEKEGAFYLFTMRMVPAIPFFIINLLMGLTKLKTWTFYWVSQLGMLAGTLVYVNAGTQIGRIDSLQDILSPKLIVSFVILGLFPWLVKWFFSRLKPGLSMF